MRRRSSIALLLAALALGGCLGPARRRSVMSTPQPRATSSPVPTIVSFATAYINWTAQTVSTDMTALAGRSVGQARSAMELAAAETSGDYELQRGGIANSGTVEAVAPLLGRREQFVVVTRELTTATNTTAYQGLQPAWHLTLATVAATSSGGWIVSGWQPEG